jgi:hypothetical protein
MVHHLTWQKLSVSSVPLKDACHIVAAARGVIAVKAKGGATFEFTDDWREVGEADGSRCHGLFVGWGGAVHRFANDGFVERLDGDTWVEVSPPDDKFGGFFPLYAFDPVHGQLVVWGSADKGRKDDTYVHDGKAWSKGKRPKEKHADVEASSGSFCLWFDPGAQRVVRAGVTQAAVFDGKAWRIVPLEGGANLSTWDRAIGDVGGRVLSVQRFISERKVVELVRAGDGYSARRRRVPCGRDTRGQLNGQQRSLRPRRHRRPRAARRARSSAGRNLRRGSDRPRLSARGESRGTGA